MLTEALPRSLQFLPLALILAICDPSRLAEAQVSENVPVTDDVYHKIDQLVAFGLVEDYLYGLRPLSRVQIARLIVQARHRLDKLPNGHGYGEIRADGRSDIEETVDELERDFSSEIVLVEGDKDGGTLEVRIFRNLTVVQNYLDSPSRPAPSDMRYGAIDAFINPLFAHRDGKRFVDGANTYLQFDNLLRGLGILAIDFTPYFYFAIPKDRSGSEQDAVIQRLSIKIGLRNVELQIGRDQVIWAQGELGGVLLSNNPAPFDLVKLSTIHPVRPPWRCAPDW